MLCVFNPALKRDPYHSRELTVKRLIRTLRSVAARCAGGMAAYRQRLAAAFAALAVGPLPSEAGDLYIPLDEIVLK